MRRGDECIAINPADGHLVLSRKRSVVEVSYIIAQLMLTMSALYLYLAYVLYYLLNGLAYYFWIFGLIVMTAVFFVAGVNIHSEKIRINVGRLDQAAELRIMGTIIVVIVLFIFLSYSTAAIRGVELGKALVVNF